MSITFTLTFKEQTKIPYEDLVNQFDREFPGLYAGISLLFRHPLENSLELTLKYQETITREQQDWLRISPFAIDFIAFYTLISPSTPDTMPVLLKEAYTLLSWVSSDLSVQDGSTRVWITRRQAWLKKMREEYHI